MKHRSSVVASALGLVFAAAPAWAGDVAQISQAGATNTAVIEQVASGGNNFAMVRQGDEWRNADNNSVQLVQYFVDNSLIDVFQSGFNNQYSVFQHDGSDLQANVNTDLASYGGGAGESNSVMIDQSGYGARAWVEQSGIYSRAEIVQQGWGGASFANVMQAGVGNQASVFQSGSDLNATIMQSSNGYGYGYGSGNSATIRQGY